MTHRQTLQLRHKHIRRRFIRNFQPFETYTNTSQWQLIEPECHSRHISIHLQEHPFFHGFFSRFEIFSYNLRLANSPVRKAHATCTCTNKHLRAGHLTTFDSICVRLRLIFHNTTSFGRQPCAKMVLEKLTRVNQCYLKRSYTPIL